MVLVLLLPLSGCGDDPAVAIGKCKVQGLQAHVPDLNAYEYACMKAGGYKWRAEDVVGCGRDDGVLWTWESCWRSPGVAGYVTNLFK